MYTNTGGCQGEIKRDEMKKEKRQQGIRMSVFVDTSGGAMLTCLA